MRNTLHQLLLLLLHGHQRVWCLLTQWLLWRFC
jgi:hypothetical protein